MQREYIVLAHKHMSTHVEKLAQSLESLHSAERNGIVRSSKLSRVHRERLVRAGFLLEVISGWLIVTNPAALHGASTIWYGRFWAFLAQYLEYRFGNEYCMSAEASIKLHTGSPTIPRQSIVMVTGPFTRTFISNSIHHCTYMRLKISRRSAAKCLMECGYGPFDRHLPYSAFVLWNASGRRRDSLAHGSRPECPPTHTARRQPDSCCGQVGWRISIPWRHASR